MTTFPDLGDWEATRSTLHHYGRVIGALPRAYAEPHPQWWHVSLSVGPDGLATDEMALPQGGLFWLKMDLTRGVIVLATSHGHLQEFDMAAGLTATEMGDHVFCAVEALGLSGTVDRARFESDEACPYVAAHAQRFLAVLQDVARLFDQYRAALEGAVSPINFWTHGFDLSTEWYGTRMVEHEENGAIVSAPAQLNLGFYPGNAQGPAYFYANPWPSEGDRLLGEELPPGAFWHTEGWEGTMLPYTELIGEDDAGARLLDYARRVYDIAAPTLMG